MTIDTASRQGGPIRSLADGKCRRRGRRLLLLLFPLALGAAVLQLACERGADFLSFLHLCVIWPTSS